jgi:hypothetical protein
MPTTLYLNGAPHRGASRYLLRSLLFLAALAALGGFFQQPLTAAFLTNPYLNGAIAAAFLFGVAYTLKALTGCAARCSRRRIRPPMVALKGPSPRDVAQTGQ